MRTSYILSLEGMVEQTGAIRYLMDVWSSEELRGLPDPVLCIGCLVCPPTRERIKVEILVEIIVQVLTRNRVIHKRFGHVNSMFSFLLVFK